VLLGQIWRAWSRDRDLWGRHGDGVWHRFDNLFETKGEEKVLSNQSKHPDYLGIVQGAMKILLLTNDFLWCCDLWQWMMLIDLREIASMLIIFSDISDFFFDFSYVNYTCASHVVTLILKKNNRFCWCKNRCTCFPQQDWCPLTCALENKI
jgi:hypothetical protein